jgi:hypothetical protein
VRISRTFIIRAEPDAVFRWIEQPELASRWQPDVAEYEITRLRLESRKAREARTNPRGN